MSEWRRVVVTSRMPWYGRWPGLRLTIGVTGFWSGSGLDDRSLRVKWGSDVELPFPVLPGEEMELSLDFRFSFSSNDLAGPCRLVVPDPRHGNDELWLVVKKSCFVLLYGRWHTRFRQLGGPGSRTGAP